MKLSISNIAWQRCEESEIFAVLRENGFSGIEVAPPKIFANPSAASMDEIVAFKEYMSKNGFVITAFQSLLFGQNELKIFDNSRRDTLSYLKKIIDLASVLGVKTLVFGSPKNRLIGEMDRKIAYKIAVEFFWKLGEYASKNGVCFCIEPNSHQYGCDFITNSSDALALIKDVNSNGFGLHVDSAVMAMNGEDIERALQMCAPYMRHFHISEPFLDFIPRNLTNHARFAAALADIGYDKWVSIEMRSEVLNSNLQAVKESAVFIKEIYG